MRHLNQILATTVVVILCHIWLVHLVGALSSAVKSGNSHSISPLTTGRSNKNSAIKANVDRNRIKSNDVNSGYLGEEVGADDDVEEFEEESDYDRSDSLEEAHARVAPNVIHSSQKSVMPKYAKNVPSKSNNIHAKAGDKQQSGKYHWKKGASRPSSDDISIDNRESTKKFKAMSKQTWSHVLDKYVTNNDICNNVRCDADEYCVVPKPGIAECVKRRIMGGDKVANKLASPHRTTLINLDETNEDISTGEDMGRDRARYVNNQKTKDNYLGSEDNEDDGDDDDNDDEEDGDDDDSTEVKDNEDKYSPNDINYQHRNNWTAKEKLKDKSKQKSNRAQSDGEREEIDDYSDGEIGDDDEEEEEEEEYNLAWRTNKANGRKAKQTWKSIEKSMTPISSTSPPSLLKFREQSPQYNNSKIVKCPSCPFGKGQIVCGTDNATYSSMCRLEFHNCVHRSTVKFACFGFCPCMKVYQKVLIKPNNSNTLITPPPPSSHSMANVRPAPHSVSLKSQYYSKVMNYGKPEEITKIKLKKGAHNSVLSKKAMAKYRYTVHMANTKSHSATGSRNKLSLNQNKTHQNHIQSCSNEQLRSMGLRLLDWFLVVMNEELKRKKLQNFKEKNQKKSNLTISSDVNTLEELMKRKYLPDCEEQVSFMFYHFDTNQDFKLSAKELYYLEHDENEHCLEPYLTQCDEDGDEYLSAYEWCSCFSLKAKPCLYHIKHMNKGGLLGGYVPQCTDKGHYQKVQCQASTNYCWCSDKNGNEIAGTRVRGKKALCDKTYPLNRNHFYNNKYVLTEQKNVKTETKRKPYQQSDIHEDLEDGDDDGDEEEFNIDHGSGFGVF